MSHHALVAVREGDAYRVARSRRPVEDLAGARHRTGRGARNSEPPGTPVASGDATAVLAALDPRRDEWLLVRDGPATPRLFAVLLLVPLTWREEGPGAAAVLVPVPDVPTGRRLRRWLRATKAVLADAVDAGLLDHALAVGYLRHRVARHPDVERREVIPVRG